MRCTDEVNVSCCTPRPRATPFPEGSSILGIIYQVLLWADMNTATPPGSRVALPFAHRYGKQSGKTMRASVELVIEASGIAAFELGDPCLHAAESWCGAMVSSANDARCRAIVWPADDVATEALGVRSGSDRCTINRVSVVMWGWRWCGGGRGKGVVVG